MSSCLRNGDCFAAGDATSYQTQTGYNPPQGVAYSYQPHGAWTEDAVPYGSPKGVPVDMSINTDSCDGSSCWVPVAPPGIVGFFSSPLALDRWSGGGFTTYHAGPMGYLDAVSCTGRGAETTCLGLGESGPETASAGHMIAGVFTVL